MSGPLSPSERAPFSRGAASARAVSSRAGAGGPRTAAGKARSSQNARRHGLASAVETATATACDRSEPSVLAMARALLAVDTGVGHVPDGGWDGTACGHDPMWERALDIAVADFDLQRVWSARLAILAHDETEAVMLREAAVLLGPDGVAIAGMADDLAPETSDQKTLDQETPDQVVPFACVRRLCALERYHMRAMARLHRARLAFEDAWSGMRTTS